MLDKMRTNMRIISLSSQHQNTSNNNSELWDAKIKLGQIEKEFKELDNAESEVKRKLIVAERRIFKRKDEIEALAEERERIISQKKANIKNEKLKMLEHKERLEFSQTKQQKLNEINKSQAMIVDECKVIFEQLKLFEIDQRDWPIIDLLIYEMETGRADSIKEALQQADLYLRHNEMKQLLQKATLTICSAIKENARIISDSIESSLSQMRREMSELNQTNITLSSKFDNFIDAQKLTNALLDKANVSSEQLANDVKRMRNIHEAEHYGYKV